MLGSARLFFIFVAGVVSVLTLVLFVCSCPKLSIPLKDSVQCGIVFEIVADIF